MSMINYCIDISIDGYIARRDHSYDFLLQEGEHLNEFLSSFSQYGTVLMGRKTYEIGLKAGIVDPALPVRQIVISSTLTSTIDRRIEIVSKNVVDTVRQLKSKTAKDILIAGGASLASSLLKEQLIDKVNLRLHPVMIGMGISVFNNTGKDIRFIFESSKSYPNGVVSLWHKVDYEHKK